MDILKAFIEALLDIIYPPQCHCCQETIEINNTDLFCVECSSQLNLMDFENHLVNPISDHFWGRISLKNSLCLWGILSEGNIHHLIHLIKYGGKEELAIELGRMLGHKLKESIWFEDVDGLVPVPIHWRRKFKRGYNQSEKIARGIHEITGVPIRSDIIKRVRHTVTQTGKNRLERMENLNHSMKLKKDTVELNHILIIDDVLTTGSTIEKTVQTICKNRSIDISLAVVATGGMG